MCATYAVNLIDRFFGAKKAKIKINVLHCRSSSLTRCRNIVMDIFNLAYNPHIRVQRRNNFLCYLRVFMRVTTIQLAAGPTLSPIR